jgi:hypothetical protein
MTPGQWGRVIAKAQLAFATMSLFAAAFLWVVAPGLTSPMFGYHFSVAVLPIAGFAGLIVGLVWMIRIYRASPEPDQQAWRYRRRG